MNCPPTFCGMLIEVEGDRLKTVSDDKDRTSFAWAVGAQMRFWAKQPEVAGASKSWVRDRRRSDPEAGIDHAGRHCEWISCG
jgi:hypothetical protein